MRFIVISGCSGGGKSTLLSELSAKAYTAIPELGREIVQEQMKAGGDKLPWKKPLLFCEEMIKRNVAAWHAAAHSSSPCIFDRSLLDAVSHYHTIARTDVNQYDHLLDELRYDPRILMVPPWPEIYVQDEERQHAFAQALEEYERLVSFYAENGYQITVIPRMDVASRLQFVLDHIQEK